MLRINDITKDWREAGSVPAQLNRIHPGKYMLFSIDLICLT